MAITNFTGQRLGSFTTVSCSTAATITYPSGSDFLLIEAHQHPVRITFDGTTPTASLGFRLAADTPYVVSVGQETTLKMIATADDPPVYIQAFRTKEDVNT